VVLGDLLRTGGRGRGQSGHSHEVLDESTHTSQSAACRGT
jgi:hypothetical protein